jgi:hypothetical protein
MRPAFLFAGIIFVLVSASAVEAIAQSGGTKSLRVYLAADKAKKPATAFSSDVSSIYAFWKGEALAAGDKIHAIWIAEDVGDAAPKDTKILEGDAQVYKSNEDGAFSLSRPGGRIWPLGKYRVEIYIDGVLAQLVKFTITPGVTIEVPKGDGG